jgi:hypothetical protein
MRTNTVSKGAYLLKDGEGDEEVFGGTLFQATTRLEILKRIKPLSSLHFLQLVGDNTKWTEVSYKDGLYYHAKQRDYLYHLLYITESPSSNLGYAKLSSIIDIPPERLRDALRTPDKSKFLPFSEQSLIYIHHKIMGSKYSDTFDNKYMF